MRDRLNYLATLITMFATMSKSIFLDLMKKFEGSYLDLTAEDKTIEELIESGDVTELMMVHIANQSTGEDEEVYLHGIRKLYESDELDNSDELNYVLCLVDINHKLWEVELEELLYEHEILDLLDQLASMLNIEGHPHTNVAETKIFTTGAYVQPMRLYSGNWKWVVTEFAEDSFLDGKLVEPDSSSKVDLDEFLEGVI